jgi:antitoxin component of MazEF toxin-antitoxin module
MEDEIEPAYPPDDGLPTPEQMSAISRLVSQEIKLKLLSSLFEETTDNQTDETRENKLSELMTAVTEENKHERIDFGKPVGRELL